MLGSGVRWLATVASWLASDSRIASNVTMPRLAFCCVCVPAGD
jgi:hypothetical protein